MGVIQQSTSHKGTFSFPVEIRVAIVHDNAANMVLRVEMLQEEACGGESLCWTHTPALH